MEVDLEQQRVFYGFVREVIITLLLALCFYILASSIVGYYKTQRREDENEEEAIVYRITVILCTVAVAVSLSSMVLLPTSIISNEIRHIYPDTFYVKWLDTSLIKSLWNVIFLGSNLCLFLLLPFAFFFSEAEGLPGTRKGVLSRAYEAILVLIMITVVVLGIVWVADSLTVHFKTLSFYFKDIKGLFSYVPFLYSCMSMLGVFITSVCTPVGFSHLFTVLGATIVQPELHLDVDQELERLSMEEAYVRRSMSTDVTLSTLAIAKTDKTLQEILEDKSRLERHVRSSIWERHLIFPLCFLILLALTCFSLLLVFVNVFSLVFTTTEHLPKGAQEHIYHLGESSASYLGPLGATIEVILIIYMTAASLVGFFNAPLVCQLKPLPHKTSVIKIILNSIILLILSSAMPVVVQVLGITKYNLFGHFNAIPVLHNFWLLLAYNVTFFVLTCSILFKRATQSVLREVTYLLRTRVSSLHIFKSSLRDKKEKSN